MCVRFWRFILCAQLFLFVLQAQTESCSFFDGVPGPASGENFTCMPPAKFGEGKVQISEQQGDANRKYLDAQIFAYDVPLPASNSLVRVATVAVGADGRTPLNTTYAYLKAAGENNADIAVLPEYFSHSNHGQPAEPLNGTTITTIRKIAQKARMYIVAPIRELSEDGKQFNSAVMIGRSGEILGTYHKVFPAAGNVSDSNSRVHNPEPGITPGMDGVRIFDLDVGRVAILICMDINFMELWQSAWAGGADIVVFPTAMAMPSPQLNALGAFFNYYIVAVGTPALVLDGLGHALAGSSFQPVPEWPSLHMAAVDLDRTFVHWDLNLDKVEALLAQYNESLRVDFAGPPYFVISSRDRERVSVRELCAQHGIVTLRQYQQDSRHGINVIRQQGGVIP